MKLSVKSGATCFPPAGGRAIKKGKRRNFIFGFAAESKCAQASTWTLHRGGLVFRPDWEKVVSCAVDFALTQPDVDPHKIVLMGVSMGGVLAPRAAAFEPRLAALVANDGIY